MPGLCAGHHYVRGTTSLAAEQMSSRPMPAAGTPLTWEQAIRMAIEKQPLIKVAEHEALESHALVKQIESANYPQVTGIVSSTAGNTRVLANLGISGSLPKPTNYLTTPGIRADYLITDFGQTAHRILSQKSLAASAEKAVLTAKALTILNVEQAYLNCLKQQRLVDISREVLNERELIRQQTEAFYRRQLRSKLDLDFASVEANRAEVVLIKAQNNLVLAFAALNTAMGLQGPGNYLLEQAVLSVPSSVSPESLVQDALNQRPELLGSKDRIQAAEEALQAAKALRFGSVTGIGTLAYTWWGHEERPSGKEVSNPGAKLGWYGLGVTSSFPLYTGGRIEGQIEEADARKGETRGHHSIYRQRYRAASRASLSQPADRRTTNQGIGREGRPRARSTDARTRAVQGQPGLYPRCDDRDDRSLERRGRARRCAV